MKRTLLTIVILLIFLNHSEVASRSKNSKPTDLSVAMVESTMKRYPTAKDLGAWGYAKSLYLYGQYLVYKRTREPRYLKYIKDWVDSHLDENGVVTNTNAQGVVSQIKYDNLDSMLPGNLLLLLYQETKEPKYKLAADRIRLRFNTYPRTKDGGFWHAASKSREWQLWGDGVFMSMPFLVRY
jgi:unsaturated rhamnogalacturonyl hydrolase